MKKIMVSLLAIVPLISFGFGTSTIDTKNKAVVAFNTVFKNAENAHWNKSAENYSVTFESKDVTSTIYYDNDGNITGSRRYYSEDRLPLNILLKIKAKYPARQIIQVTEVMEDDSILYGIRLEDEVFTIMLEVNSYGHIRQVLKYIRQKETKQ
jgi:uncharacterized protein YxeA